METILIVDDEYANRFLLEHILSECKCISVSSAEDMWTSLANNAIDLIIMDVMMPGQDGFDAARQLRETKEYAEIPIIFVTARRDVTDVVEGFDIGGNDYIKKPFDEVELLSRVKYSLKKRREQKNLNRIVITDAATGLYNRYFLDDHIRRETDKLVRGISYTSVAMCDIDHFKKTNDIYGHQCGDYILRLFSNTIKESIRTYDIAIRFGGEEFLVLFPSLYKNEATPIIERLRDIHHSIDHQYNGKNIPFTFSAGVADSSEVALNAEIFNGIIALADSRLYNAKQSGRDRIITK